MRNVIERLCTIRRERKVMDGVEFEQVTTPQDDQQRSSKEALTHCGCEWSLFHEINIPLILLQWRDVQTPAKRKCAL